MSTITPLPQSEGSLSSLHRVEPHLQQHHDGERRKSRKAEPDYTVPIKPPSEYGGSMNSANVSGRSSNSSRDKSFSRGRVGSGSGTRSPGPVKGVLRVGKHSRHPSIASQSVNVDGIGGQSRGTSSDAATSTATGMSRNLLETASVDSLERRFQELIRDDSPASSNIADMAAMMSVGDAIVVKGASATDSARKESILGVVDDSVLEREDNVGIPLRKIPVQQQKQPIQQQEQKEEKVERRPSDKIRNPFGRPLPR